MVLGDNGKRYLTSDVKKFDPTSIPLKSWEVREQELLERGQLGEQEPPFFPPEEEAEAAERAAGRYSGRQKLASRSAASMLLPEGEGGLGGLHARRRGEPVVPMGMVQQAEAMSGLNGRLSASRVGPRQGAEQRRMSSPAPVSPVAAAGSLTSASLTSAAVTAAPVTPSDEELLAEVRRVLSSGKLDLGQVTRRQVRTHLESMFACDLTARKHAINAMIQAVLPEGDEPPNPPPVQ